MSSANKGRLAKALGQFDTPEGVAALAAALTVTRASRTVLDPSCGSGNMLVAVQSASTLLGNRGPIRAVGWEVDARIAAHARRRVGPGAEVRRAEAFSVLASRSASVLHSYDLVIGNPPYVRYQELHSLLEFMPKRLVEAATHRLGSQSPSRIVDAVIRAALLREVLERSSEPGGALDLLLEEPAPTRDAVDRAWLDLVRGYSGHADLSLPMWLLTWLMAKPNGTIAYVTSASLWSRKYGDVLETFMRTFLEPVISVQQDGNSWFADAQVATRLAVFRARSRSEIARRLRGGVSDGTGRLFRVDRGFNLARSDTLTGLGSALGSAPTLAACAHTVALALRTGAENAAWRLSDQHEKAQSGRSVGGSATRSLPAGLTKVLPTLPRTVHSLGELGVTVNQGLRTGCNDFFYLERIRAESTGPHIRVRSSARMGSMIGLIAQTYVAPAVRRQADIQGWQVSSGSLSSLVLTVGSQLSDTDFSALHSLPAPIVNGWLEAGIVARVPRFLGQMIARAELTTLNGRRIPTLSAVAPNRRWPTPRSASSRAPVRGWYSLTLRPRHTGDVFVPRVVASTITAYLNDVSAPAYVDANFSTLTCAVSLDPFVVFALLNSAYARAYAELLGSPLGGGALKLEAEHLRRLMFPAIAPETLGLIGRLGRALASCSFATSESVIRQIDVALLGEFVSTDQLYSTREALVALATELALQRARSRLSVAA